MRHRTASILAAGAVLCFVIGIASIAYAQDAAPSAPATATAPYELDFTLPSESRSGCLVCHGDPALVRVRGGAIVSFYIEESVVLSSTHAKQQCVGCHVDFTYRSPHTAEGWQVTAKSACRNCHDAQSRSVGAGVHRPSVETTTATAPVAESAETSPAPKPLCGDCHGSHDMAALTEKGGKDWKAGQLALKKQG
jgi:nitrate reductase cytochrome c-type subunit